MRKILTVAIIISLTLSLSACSVFGIRTSVPEVPYTVIDRIGEVEIRSYNSRVIAEVSNAKKSSEAFYLLFDYISGENETKRSIAMTAPVEVSDLSKKINMTAPVEVVRNNAGEVSMRFFLPQEYALSSAPVPKDARVRLNELPPQRFAAIRYSGVSSESTFKAMSEKIRSALQGTRWTIAGEPRFFGFDPPFTIPFLRRNEAMIPVAE